MSETPPPHQSTAPVQTLEQSFPDLVPLIGRLRHRDQNFRRLASYYESLAFNIHAIETGREEASASYLDMLRTQRDQARQDIEQLLADAPPYADPLP